ncbi:type II toxin-antitoxin system RelE/ParE family toxin [Desulfobotulus sp. H1]|uniref:Type II toxin-antitoxin system RelE/ParE family toxin n=1 Tax=Desulfobotulus pelophilus TaxID=2823377 RepID=A0ABT3NDE5_9BACT|nr:type II toxin-antitoxin system RelE/ParE family toxin [Desulfobotulus pelophilus]MCW7755487.1 type II toxin-antitoxin system RelE/ParE family toxin [Desulfobotulus pelophilus]
MTYKLTFLPVALKEWKKLDPSIRVQLKKKLEEIIQNPKIPANRLRQFENHYKIKLKSSGYRLVYEVIESEIVVLVIVIGKREGNKVYEVAKLRT